MRRTFIRVTAVVAVIGAAVGYSATAPAQMGLPDTAGQLQKWEDTTAGTSCYGECPGSFCCRT